MPSWQEATTPRGDEQTTYSVSSSGPTQSATGVHSIALSPTDLKQHISPSAQSAASSQVIGVVVRPPTSRKLGGQLAGLVKTSRRPIASPRISQQVLVELICWLTPPQRTVGDSQLPAMQRWLLSAGPHLVRSSTFCRAGQSATVLHWFTARHIPVVRVSVSLHTPLQVTSGQRASSGGATQAPVPGWQVAQIPEQAPAQQNPPVQIPLWHWLPAEHSAPGAESGRVHVPLVHSPEPPPMSVQVPPLVASQCPAGPHSWHSPSHGTSQHRPPVSVLTQCPSAH